MANNLDTSKGLQIWLPLTKDLNNQGLAKVSITNNGATYSSRGGKLGGCYNFNDNCIGIQNLPITQDISIAFWMKPSNISQAGCLLNYRASIGSDLAVFLIRGNIRFDAGGQTIFSDYIFTTNWQHVCVVKEGSTKKLYIDGQLKQTVTGVGNVSCTAIKGTIGQSSTNTTNGADNAYIGLLNDFRIYSYALSHQEIKEISRGLVGHWLGNDPWVQQLTSAHSNPMFNTRNGNGDWSHWAPSGSSGTYGQTTDNQYVYPGFSQYAHKVQCSGGKYYLCYTEQVFSGGYRSAQAIVKRNDGGIINSNVVTIDYNGGMDGGIQTYIPLANGFYLIKREGFQQPDGNSSGSNSNLVSLLVRPGYTIYATCFYIENNKQLCSHVFNSIAPAFLSDISGMHLDLEVKGNGITLNTNTPRYDKCLSFNGNGYLETNNLNINSSEPHTLSFWFYPKESGQMICSFNNGLNLYTSSRYISLNDGGDGASNHFGNWQFTLNTWYHIAIIFNGSTARLYVNGEDKGTVPTYRSLNGPKMIIGAYINGTLYRYTGMLSDIRLYATALDTTAIQELKALGH